MPKIHKIADQLCFYCPGCEYYHGFGASWTFNGDFNKPTFAPSLLINKSHPESRCHLFVRNGQIEYQSDCFHRLAGQTVELPDWEN